MKTIIILDDDVTPQSYVSLLLIEVFEKTTDEATSLTQKTHEAGEAVVGYFEDDLAEQLTNYQTVGIAYENGDYRAAEMFTVKTV